MFKFLKSVWSEHFGTRVLIKNWIKALRSGKYKQGVGRLKLNDTYCCLGVLCQIAGLKQTVVPDNNGATSFHYGGYESCAYLPGSFAKELGLDKPPDTLVDPFGNYPDSPAERRLAVLNDKGKNFNQIADFIEKYILPKAGK